MRELEEQIEKYPKVSGDGQVYLSQILKDIVSKAEEEARKMKDEFLSAEHILLAVSNYKKANSVFRSLGMQIR